MNFISFLTDFGIHQEYVGVCKAVMLGINPDAVIVDISHTVSPFNILEAAFMLKSFVIYAPQGVHVAVIDPGVGTQRKGVAIQTVRGDYLVGPDNGVLSLAAESLGIATAVALENKTYMREPISSSFHGRDIFSPAGAYLSRGILLEDLGSPLQKNSLHTVSMPTWKKDKTGIHGYVLRIDRFGNIQTTIHAEILEKKTPVTVDIGDNTLIMPVVTTFGEVAHGEFLLYEDSDGLLTVAQNQEDAARTLSISPMSEVTIRS